MQTLSSWSNYTDLFSKIQVVGHTKIQPHLSAVFGNKTNGAKHISLPRHCLCGEKTDGDEGAPELIWQACEGVSECKNVVEIWFTLQKPFVYQTCWLEDSRVALAVARSERLHHTVNLLGFTRQAETPEELPATENVSLSKNVSLVIILNFLIFSPPT